MKYLALVTLLLSTYTHAVTVTFTGIVGGTPKFETPKNFKVEEDKLSWKNNHGEELSSGYNESNRTFYISKDDKTNKKIISVSI